MKDHQINASMQKLQRTIIVFKFKCKNRQIQIEFLLILLCKFNFLKKIVVLFVYHTCKYMLDYTL